MAKLSDLKLKYRLYMQAYPYRHIDWRPGAQLRKPLSASTIAVVTSAAFYSADQRRFDPCATSPWGWSRASSRNRESLRFPSLFFVRSRNAFGHHARWLSIVRWGIPWESRAMLRCRNESFSRRWGFLRNRSANRL